MVSIVESYTNIIKHSFPSLVKINEVVLKMGLKRKKIFI